MPSTPTYLALSPNCSLRLLESPCIYDRVRDELYELDEEGLDFMRSLPLPINGTEIANADTEFLRYCIRQQILAHVAEYAPRKEGTPAPIPSLRYLLLHITTRCNLKCAHCFLGDTEPIDLPFEDIARIMKEFDELQGLRLLVSGGEPLLHPRFWDINELFDQHSFRTVILSNGTTLSDSAAVRRLRAHEVQVSIDGVGPTHDALRGFGNYEKSLKGLENLLEAGIDLSIATMVHAKNVDDFCELERILKAFGAKEWNIDVPAHAGRWRHGNPLELDARRKIGPLLERAFGGGAHRSCSEGDDLACGAHLCAVMADGAVCKCGFYSGSPVGTVQDGLAEAWSRIPRTRLSQLRCDCDLLDLCRGGCRYRAEIAGDTFGKDPVMCDANGLLY
ncbi:MAG: radical SAM protein [Candidatus Lindowbacteria bacterium]|nr:radical SAM protein [Candidatus Lindowbacteria bacterium]